MKAEVLARALTSNEYTKIGNFVDKSLPPHAVKRCAGYARLIITYGRESVRCLTPRQLCCAVYHSRAFCEYISYVQSVVANPCVTARLGNKR